MCVTTSLAVLLQIKMLTRQKSVALSSQFSKPESLMVDECICYDIFKPSFPKLSACGFA